MFVIQNIQSTDKANVNDIVTDSFRQNSLKADMPKGAGDNELGGDPASIMGKKSMFNPWFVVNMQDNVYTDEDYAIKSSDFLPTMSNLLSKGTGANKYDEYDFLYAKDYGEHPNNRMITLRRFAYPCFDDIFTSFQKEPDIGRMITWFNQDTNKLEDIMNFSYGMRWQAMSSSSEQAQHNGETEGTSGYMKSMVRLIDPQISGGRIRGDNELNYDPQHDSNKVYGPVDSISDTHIRDVGLDFSHDINLTFDYSLKSVNGVNGKAAFIDLLSNIIATTTNDAKFWGGARYWVGGKPSKWANELREFTNDIFQARQQGDFASLKTFTAEFASKIGKAANPENLANNIINLALGSLLNKLGRASIPTMNSLLTGNPIGLWHITVGNPLRPIAVMGNMLLTNTVIQPIGDALGIDDFPTDIRVVCTLKHAMPRGRAEIESMFNMGKARTYWKPSEEELESMLKNRPVSLQGFQEASLRHVIRDNYSLVKRTK